MIFRAPGLVTGGFLYGNMLKAAELISSQWSNNFNDSIYVGGKDYSPLALGLQLYLDLVLLSKPPHPIRKYRALASSKTTRS